MSSPSKQQQQQQLTPSRQRRHLLGSSSAGDEATTTTGSSNELIFAPQVSKESKMSVYDLDNDEAETAKGGSVHVFDLGESGTDSAKLRIGPVTKVTKLFLFLLFINKESIELINNFCV